ncbi:unnamed protein product [Periconia digitata]|uniref:Zn(2)-C6 fungal-type domain-containing protein n=1 Tax=Periconia digitata TaxID=1303443 RepID=A0A9W4UQD5_9PLEO|nr:unnamed protein product [Periconia digitata]
MPAERTRAPNSQGRQKSCSECAKGKRKCDLRQPSCGRCARLQLLCTWPPSHYAAPAYVSSAPTPASPVNDANTVETMQEMETPSWPSLDTFEIPSTLDTTFLDLGLNLPPSCYDFESSNDSGSTVALPQYGTYNPHQKSPSLLAFSPMAESRIGYSMKQWEKVPTMMVRENCTFWSHAKLYEDRMPKSMADAYATCALSMSRNKSNARFIARHIAGKACELTDEAPPIQPLEVLARAHALLLYMILLLCSGDIRCFAQVQTLLPHLETSATSIFTNMPPNPSEEDSPTPSPLPIYPTTTARAFWTSFIFRESARRTLLVICHAIACCRVMAGDITSCSHELAVGNRVTISAKLWNAASPLEFAERWNEKQHFLVRDLDFAHVLRDAAVEDLDVFGKMILVGSLGSEDMVAWFRMKGGEL